jgi:hypothetical protein
MGGWGCRISPQLASTVARRIDTALTTVSISNADHEGWLAKRRELIDEYKQRYLLPPSPPQLQSLNTLPGCFNHRHRRRHVK